MGENVKNSARFSIVAFGLLVISSLPAMAASVYGTSVGVGDLTGSRTYAGGGLKQVDGTLADGATVEWDISWNGTYWSYIYDFYGFGSDMSHVTFDVSGCFIGETPECLIVDNTVYIEPFDEEKGIEFGDIDGIISAFKTNGSIPGGNADGFSISFLSTNAPMWADMYLAAGQFNAANYWWDNHNDSDTIAGYIPTPDTVGYVPVPAALWLFGSGLIGLVGIARRKKAA